MLTSLNLENDRPLIKEVSTKLKELFPQDLITVSTEKLTSGLSAINISGYLFSENGNRMSQHLIATIIVLDVVDEKGLSLAYDHSTEINESERYSPYPILVGSDLGGISIFVLGVTSDINLQSIGAAMVTLNSNYASEYWLDAVGVLDKGVLNYTAFIPAQTKRGDFFLPKDHCLDGPTPSVSINLTARGSSDGTFEKITSLVLARCGIAIRDVRIPRYDNLSHDFPRLGLMLLTYQFDLGGQLKPQLFKQVVAAHLPGTRFLIVSQKETLGRIRYYQWQDGAVLSIDGKFPLDHFLVFLKEIVPSLTPSHLQLFRGEEIQVSYVLPITQAEFLKTLEIFDQRSSNIRIELDQEKHLVEKVSNEGLSSQFVARLKYGILSLREALFLNDATRNRFDRQYDDMYNSLQSVQEARNKIIETWSSHKRKFQNEEIISKSGNTVRVDESINRTILRETENLWNAAVRTIKQRAQVFLRENGVDTSFLFKKESTFLSGIEKLRLNDFPLAEYLLATRQWTEPLVLLRNDQLEHGEPVRLKVEYDISLDPPVIIEPEIAGMPITEYVDFICDRCCNYAEDMTIHCLKKQLPPSLTIIEIPKKEREENFAVRFSLSISACKDMKWSINYSEASFYDR